MRGLAIILSVPERISPFNEPAKEAFFSGETIAQTQDRAFARMRFSVVRAESAAEAKKAAAAATGPVMLLLNRIYISEKAAADFLKAAKKSKRPAALALSVNASVDYTLPLQDLGREGEWVVHDVLLVDGVALPEPIEDPVAWLRQIRAQAVAVEVPKREIVAEIQLPTIGERAKTKMRYPVTSTVVVSVEHWVHILWLNQIAFGIRWVELIRRKPLWALWRALTAFSLNRFRLLDRMVRRGQRTRIHPTAYVSASILGKDVKIGAGATVRNSIVADGVVIQDHAVLLNCVVGKDALITENAFLVSCVIYPEASVGNYKMQVSLVGRGAYVNSWASFVDAKFVGSVKVQHRGALVSTERAFLGSVIGHRAKMAAKVLIQPGREIPNDTIVVMRPDEVISEIPPDLPPNVPLVRHEGTLVPLRSGGAQE